MNDSTAKLVGDDTITHTGKQFKTGEQTLDVYAWVGDGGRELLYVGVDTDTLQLFIAPVTTLPIDLMDSDMWKLTKGRAHTHETDIGEGDDPVPVTEICLSSIMRYMMPRIATMMGRVYVK